MAYAEISNGVVVNTLLAEAAFAASQGWVELPEGAGIGWLYDGKKFTAPPVVDVPATDDAVNAERDRRMVLGFTFGGRVYQSRREDRENVMGAFALASTALTIGGKKPGDLRWHGEDEDFMFIAANNERVPMDAPTVLALGQAAAAQKSALTFAASNLKLLDPIPADYADDAHWPAHP